MSIAKMQLSLKFGARSPPSGFIKLNSDGSWISTSGEGGIGVIARNEHGQLMGGTAKSVTTSTALQVELQAISDGLSLAISNGWSNVEVESDNQKGR
ncbi:putative ribonuclease H-like domain-containing protein [Rosa chinensis]|uniref:Putative ribonuclease H-like domain-containing protein n=1 Tax=Rosa chinensis TaxID=74649 RepID=A0A2P6RCI6_ROSCH|nr:putative ribonuclease H-like domain-containing protein [Rosa chinensis]